MCDKEGLAFAKTSAVAGSCLLTATRCKEGTVGGGERLGFSSSNLAAWTTNHTKKKGREGKGRAERKKKKKHLSGRYEPSVEFSSVVDSTAALRKRPADPIQQALALQPRTRKQSLTKKDSYRLYY